MDISAVLQELSLLRQEVRMISQLRAELNELKVNQQNMRSIPIATTAARVMTDEFPPLASASSVDMPVLSRSATSDTNILNDINNPIMQNMQKTCNARVLNHANAKLYLKDLTSQPMVNCKIIS